MLVKLSTIPLPYEKELAYRHVKIHYC